MPQLTSAWKRSIALCAFAGTLGGLHAASLAQSPPPSGEAPKASSQTSHVLQIKRQLTGEFTYRVVVPGEAGSPPAPLPAAATPDAAAPISVPEAAFKSKGLLEVVDKQRGNVAQIPLASVKSDAITLTEASFNLVQTVFVAVQHNGKSVSDVLVTLSDPAHKGSFAYPLKPSDNGVAQFNNVPMGVPITVAVNAAGHPATSQTSTLIPGHTPDGYHWPVISVDWNDVPTLTPPAPPVTADKEKSDKSDSKASTSEKPEPSGGGLFSSVVNLILSLAVIAGLIYGAVWAFNKGHIKTLLDKAGVNTADIPAGGGVQPSPFDKPARQPLTPITEGTADPLIGGPVASAAPSGIASGPRLIATAGATSGSIFALTSASSDIGRDPGNAVPLPTDNNASRRHATVVNTGGQFTITDNGSSNGTFVNGVKIAPNTPQPLRSGDEVQVGLTRFRFENQ